MNNPRPLADKLQALSYQTQKLEGSVTHLKSEIHLVLGKDPGASADGKKGAGGLKDVQRDRDRCRDKGQTDAAAREKAEEACAAAKKELIDLKRELRDMNKKGQTQQRAASSESVRLQRALEEVDKHKATITKLKTELREKTLIRCQRQCPVPCSLPEIKLVVLRRGRNPGQRRIPLANSQ